MNFRFAALALPIALCGCGGEFAKIIPTAPASFAAGVLQGRVLEARLVAEYLNEDQVLRYLSEGRYRCGDPRSPFHKAVQKRRGRTGPNVTAFQSDKVWSASIKVIETYAAYLKMIVDGAETDARTIDALTAAVGEISKNITIAAPYTSTIGPVGGLAKHLRQEIALGDLAAVALAMKHPLTVAVRQLEVAYQRLSADEKAAFNMWDSCARERLAYLRQINDATFQLKWGPMIVPSTGNELAAAYAAYLDKRKEFLDQRPDIKKLLADILTQNEKLILDASNVTAASVLETGTALAKVINAGYEVRGN